MVNSNIWPNSTLLGDTTVKIWVTLTLTLQVYPMSNLMTQTDPQSKNSYLCLTLAYDVTRLPYKAHIKNCEGLCLWRFKIIQGQI